MKSQYQQPLKLNSNYLCLYVPDYSNIRVYTVHNTFTPVIRVPLCFTVNLIYVLSICITQSCGIQ